jgi:hypothetical protein
MATFNIPRLPSTAEPTPVVPYGVGPAFDFNTGEFVTDAAGRIVMVDGYRTWVQWVAKAAITQRGVYPIYPPSYGADLAEAMAQPTPDTARVAITRAIRESVTANPQTKAVENLIAVPAGEGADISGLVSPQVGSPVKIDLHMPLP